MVLTCLTLILSHALSLFSPSLCPSLPLQISDGTDVRAAALEIFMQVVDISPYLVRDFIMQEAKNHDDKEVGSRKMFIE